MKQKEKEAVVARVFENMTSREHARVIDKESVSSLVRECVFNVLKNKEYFAFQSTGDTLVLVYKDGKTLFVEICKLRESSMIDIGE